MSEKTALITGGSKGMGRELVRTFSRNGFNIITCARDEAALSELRSEIQKSGGKIFTAVCNVREPEEIKSFIKSLGSVRIDVLINNAGVFVPGQIHTEEESVFGLMMETNLQATYHFCREVIPMMHDSSKPHIFNICSTASITAYPNGGSYCISKFAQYGLTKVLREELKPKAIAVTAVLPGATRTGSWDGTDLPDERFIKPTDVASAIFSCYQLENGVVEDLLIRPMLGDIL
ncbi:MAG: SDR family NAD(P)-dependent oxidoreductase [Bacteroidetes bacterium]|nr:SDR family NAD(P)-dependent oxidoreductase [Bacteroidota bacterium]